MGEEAALAHLQLGRQAADRQPLEPLGGGEVDGAVEDRGPGRGALAARSARGGGIASPSGYRKARTFVQIARIAPAQTGPRLQEER